MFGYLSTFLSILRNTETRLENINLFTEFFFPNNNFLFIYPSSYIFFFSQFFILPAKQKHKCGILCLI